MELFIIGYGAPYGVVDEETPVPMISVRVVSEVGTAVVEFAKGADDVERLMGPPVPVENPAGPTVPVVKSEELDSSRLAWTWISRIHSLWYTFGRLNACQLKTQPLSRHFGSTCILSMAKVP